MKYLYKYSLKAHDTLLIEEEERLWKIVKNLRSIKQKYHIKDIMKVEWVKDSEPLPDWYFKTIEKLAKVKIMLVDKLSDKASLSFTAETLIVEP